MTERRTITAEEAALLSPFAEGSPMRPYDETSLQIARIEREREAHELQPHHLVELGRLNRLGAAQAGELALQYPRGPRREVLLSMRDSLLDLAAKI